MMRPATSIPIRVCRAFGPAMTLVGLLLMSGCEKDADRPQQPVQTATRSTERLKAPATRPAGSARTPPLRPAAIGANAKIVHVFVALCDNEHQGIARVPAALGNGQNPSGNLYWGAMYGFKTFFSRSKHWRVVECPPQPAGGAPGRDRIILDRAVFVGPQAATGSVYVIGEAYDGAHMKAALADFFHAAAGQSARSVEIVVEGQRLKLPAAGRADMVCFVGHNGMMDAAPDELPSCAGGANPSQAVVLACRSHAYFAAPLLEARCTPLIATTGNMAPEAYTLDAIIRAWAAGGSAAQCRRKAAEAYSRYQKCSLPAAMRLFVAGR